MVFLDYQDPRPIYEQIADMYKKFILQGVMTANEALPSVRKLAVELSTNPNTVQKAYSMLEHDGYVYSVKGRGNFVKDDPALREKKILELKERLDKVFIEADDFGISRSELLGERGKRNDRDN